MSNAPNILEQLLQVVTGEMEKAEKVAKADEKPVKINLKTQLEETIVKIIDKRYDDMFKAAMADKSPKQYDTTVMMRKAISEVRTIVETQLQKTMTDFHNSDSDYK